MRAITDKQWARLPAYAREEIEGLERENATLHKQLDKALRTLPASRVWCGHQHTGGVTPLPDETIYFGPRVGDHHFTVRYDNGKLMIHSVDLVAVLPRAANHIELEGTD